MEKGNTRDEILKVALDLFSVNGYEATSISQIADAVGIRKASLYSHFSNKQDILDTVIATVLDGYDQHSVFANADWDDPTEESPRSEAAAIPVGDLRAVSEIRADLPSFAEDKKGMTADDALKMIQGQVRYILHDPQISRGRKMLMIEQFRNQELAQLHSRMNYDDILKFFAGMIRFMIRERTLKKGDPELMAAQLALPVTVWINLCDRQPEREEEAMGLIEKHVKQFFEIYKKK